MVSNPQGGNHPITDCNTARAVFNTLSTTPGSQFATSTPAQQLALALSCQGGACPDNSRVGEFFILRKDINIMKAAIIGYNRINPQTSETNIHLPSCSTSQGWDKIRDELVATKMVFDYMNQRVVANVLDTVNNRMKTVLAAVDADPSYTAHPNIADYVPAGRPITWQTAYDEFMVQLLTASERKMKQWMADCANTFTTAVGDTTNDEGKQAWATWVQGQIGGQYSSTGTILQGDVYSRLKDGQEV